MYLGGAANCIPDTVGSTPVPRRMGAVDCIADTVCMTLEHAHVSKLYLGYSSQHPCHVAWGCCQLYPRYSLQHPVFLESTTPWFCLWCVNFNRSLHSAKVAKCCQGAEVIANHGEMVGGLKKPLKSLSFSALELI